LEDGLFKFCFRGRVDAYENTKLYIMMVKNKKSSDAGQGESNISGSVFKFLKPVPRGGPVPPGLPIGRGSVVGISDHNFKYRV